MPIRELTEDDAEVFWAVRLRALREEITSFGSSYEDAKDRPLSTLREQMRTARQKGDFTLGAFEGDTLVGIAAFVRATGRKNQHCGDIYSVYITPEARGTDRGRALMETLIARVRTLDGLEQVYLAVTSVNAAAIGLYRTLGFESFGRQPRVLKLPDGRYLDEELMVLWL